MLSPKLRLDIIRVLKEHCDTKEYGVRDAISFAGCIPELRHDLPIAEQPEIVKAIFKRCADAGERIYNESTEDKEKNTQARRGLAMKMTSGREVLLHEDIIATAHIVEKDKAGVCHTFSQFAFMKLLHFVEINGQPLKEIVSSLSPSIKIVANQSGHHSHTFVLIGYDHDDYSTSRLGQAKEEFLIIDLWLYALNFRGELDCGVYTYNDYPQGFMSHLKCVYDSHNPYTRADWTNYLLEQENATYPHHRFFSPLPMDIKKIDRLNKLMLQKDYLEDEIRMQEEDVIDSWGEEIDKNPAIIKDMKRRLHDLLDEIESQKTELRRVQETAHEPSISEKSPQLNFD